MNRFEADRNFAERMKRNYPVGTRLELINMTDPYAPVPPGTRGTVSYVDDIGQIGMKWDNGRSLSLIPGEDSYRRLTPEEIEAEQQTVKARETLRDQVAALAVKGAEQILRKEVNAGVHADLLGRLKTEL